MTSMVDQVMRMSSYAALIVSLVAALLSGTAEARTFTVRASDCKALVRHLPNDDVTYRPGVDVRGKPVVSADAETEHSLELPDTIELIIGIDLADRLPQRGGRQTRPALPYEGESIFGVLSIDHNNVLWNGEPIDSNTQLALAEACRAAIESSSSDKSTVQPLSR